MTLDEAIKYCMEVAENKEQAAYNLIAFATKGERDECIKCADEHRQLADWLKLLKRILDSGDCNICGIKKVCQVKPNWGEQVRYNCPLYVKEEDEWRNLT